MNYVTWDLFRERDCLLPTTTEDAMGLALGYCTNVDNTLRLTAQKATVVSVPFRVTAMLRHCLASCMRFHAAPIIALNGALPCFCVNRPKLHRRKSAVFLRMVTDVSLVLP